MGPLFYSYKDLFLCTVSLYTSSLYIEQEVADVSVFDFVFLAF